MILVRVLQANVQMIGMFLSNVGITIFGRFDGQAPVDGLMWFLAPVNGPTDWMWWISDLGHAPWEIILRLGIDMVFMVVGVAIFALICDQDRRSRLEGRCAPDPPLLLPDPGLREAGSVDERGRN